MSQRGEGAISRKAVGRRDAQNRDELRPNQHQRQLGTETTSMRDNLRWNDDLH